jgi:hypothetical protein
VIDRAAVRIERAGHVHPQEVGVAEHLPGAGQPSVVADRLELGDGPLRFFLHALTDALRLHLGGERQTREPDGDLQGRIRSRSERRLRFLHGPTSEVGLPRLRELDGKVGEKCRPIGVIGREESDRPREQAARGADVAAIGGATRAGHEVISRAGSEPSRGGVERAELAP